MRKAVTAWNELPRPDLDAEPGSSDRIEGTIIDVYPRGKETVVEYHSPDGVHCMRTFSPDETITVTPTDQQREAHKRGTDWAVSGAAATTRTSYTYDPRRYPEQREACRRAAFDVLPAFKRGDPVTVTIDGKDHDMIVTRSARRSDGAFGSWESTRITVSYGPGRYSTEVTAERVATGAQSIRRRDSVD